MVTLRTIALTRPTRRANSVLRLGAKTVMTERPREGRCREPYVPGSGALLVAVSDGGFSLVRP